MNKKIVILIATIILIIAVVVGTTYALFFKVDKSEKDSSYKTGLLKIEKTSDSGDISLTNTFPMKDDAGKQSQVYTYSITNNGNLTYTFDVKMLAKEGSNFDSQYIKVMVDGDEPVSYNSLSSNVIKKGLTLAPKASTEIKIRVWLAWNTPNSQIGKTFTATLTTDGVASETSTTNEVQDSAISSDEPFSVNSNASEQPSAEENQIGDETTPQID